MSGFKRHFGGRLLGDEHEDSSDSDEDETEDTQHHGQAQKKISMKPVFQQRPITRRSTIPVDENEEGIDAGDGDDDDDDEEEGQSGEDSESCSSDDDDDSDSGSSDDEPQMLKPVFLSKRQRSQVRQTPKHAVPSVDKVALAKERTLKTIETHIQQERDYRRELALATQNYGGIDDTDDADPEAERAEWELRQLQREKREREQMEKEMEELEDLEDRRLRTEEERDEEARLKFEEEQKKKELKTEEGQQLKVKGAFYQDEGLLKRRMDGEVEKYDKTLLPQRYRAEGKR